VARVLDRVELFRGSKVLIALPEHQVKLDGGGHASQTDLWVLLAAPKALLSMAVEGKAGESFDKTVPQWLKGASDNSGKRRRLGQLCRMLSINEDQASLCRYQLLHRAAAALIEAHRFRTGVAVMLVQVFAQDAKGFADFMCFGEQLGVSPTQDALFDCGMKDDVNLWIGWVNCAPARQPPSPDV
jgi:hypothetical protein